MHRSANVSINISGIVKKTKSKSNRSEIFSFKEDETVSKYFYATIAWDSC